MKTKEITDENTDNLGEPPLAVGTVLSKTGLSDYQDFYKIPGCGIVFIGKTQKMQEVFQLVEKVAPTDSNVLLLGETGTGKSLIAKIIHSKSQRRHKPMVNIICGALPVSLQESELFGHAKGSFTGADHDKTGLIESAHESTIFLDEIGEMSMTTQADLLYFLESGRIRRIGETEEMYIDARVISATNCDIEESIKQGKVREDLYYRLNVISIYLPPLRERRGDIIPLAKYFLSLFSMELDRSVPDIPESIAKQMIKYQWPGNIRELENAMERAALLAKDGSVTESDLPSSIFGNQETTDRFTVEGDLTLSQVEREYILYQLDRCDWNRSLTAERLDIGRNTLWRKLKKYGITGKGESIDD